MGRSIHLFPDEKRTLVEQFSPFVFSHIPVEHSQIIHTQSHFWMSWSKNVLTNGKRMPVKWLSLCKLALSPAKRCQAMKTVRCVSMHRPQCLLSDGQSRL